MGKLFKTFFAATVSIAAVVVYRESGPPTEPEIMDDDAWWGPSERSADRGSTVVRPFRIDISTEVRPKMINYRIMHNSILFTNQTECQLAQI